jgi:hypothetical protein
MFLYSLHGYEDNTVLIHNEKFTKEQFVKMCDEAPQLKIMYYGESYDSVEIVRHLIKQYGFQTAEYTADLFID